MRKNTGMLLAALAMSGAMLGPDVFTLKKREEDFDRGQGIDPIDLGRRAEKDAEALRKAESKRARKTAKRLAAMKVFGVNYDGRSRRLVAAETQKKAAKIFGMKLHYFREYGSETRNAEEIALATKEPYVVWSQAYSHDAPWIRVSHNV